MPPAGVQTNVAVTGELDQFPAVYGLPPAVKVMVSCGCCATMLIGPEVMVCSSTETADNLKKHGGFIPGIRPGERTAEYIDYVLSRITVVGALYLAIVCLIPEILISYAAVPFYFGGTSLLIVVSVTMDTVAQIQGYLLAHQYEGLIKRSKLRGRTR